MTVLIDAERSQRSEYQYSVTSNNVWPKFLETVNRKINNFRNGNEADIYAQTAAF
jgi:hypothetical protein